MKKDRNAYAYLGSGNGRGFLYLGEAKVVNGQTFTNRAAFEMRDRVGGSAR